MNFNKINTLEKFQLFIIQIKNVTVLLLIFFLYDLKIIKNLFYFIKVGEVKIIFIR